LRPALEVIGAEPGASTSAHLHDDLPPADFFFADTTVNIEPDAETSRKSRPPLQSS